MGKTRKDEQRQTNLNSNPDDEKLGEVKPVFMRVGRGCQVESTAKVQQIFNV